MTSTIDIHDNVRQGAKVLDAAKPGWANSVNVDTLEMCSTSECVLGQVYGDYWTGLRALGFGIGSDMRYVYGYSLKTGDDTDWVTLNGAWRKEIKGRLMGDALVADAERTAREAQSAPSPRVRKPRYVQSAEVSVTYAPGQNVSVTKRGGVITKVTTWTTGVSGSTRRH